MDNVFYEAQAALTDIANRLEQEMDEWEADFDAEALTAFEVRWKINFFCCYLAYIKFI